MTEEIHVSRNGVVRFGIYTIVAVVSVAITATAGWAVMGNDIQNLQKLADANAIQIAKHEEEVQVLKTSLAVLKQEVRNFSENQFIMMRALGITERAPVWSREVESEEAR